MVDATTRPQPKKSSKSESYLDIRKNTENGSADSTLRKYHFSAEEKKRLLTEADTLGTTVNPLQNRRGVYWGQIQAIIELGVDEYHSPKAIRDKMRDVMSAVPKRKKLATKQYVDTTLWDDFVAKAPRENASKPKGALGRIEQSFRVLQRLPKASGCGGDKNPYGLKLAQFGICVDIDYRENPIPGESPLAFVRLNTKWDEDDDGLTIKPVYNNPFSKRRGPRKASKGPVVSEGVEGDGVDSGASEGSCGGSESSEVVVEEKVETGD